MNKLTFFSLLLFFTMPLYANENKERKALVALIKANNLPGVIAMCEAMPLRRFNQVQPYSNRHMRREKKTLEDYQKKPYDLAFGLGHFVMAQQIHAIQQEKEAERAAQRRKRN